MFSKKTGNLHKLRVFKAVFGCVVNMLSKGKKKEPVPPKSESRSATASKPMEYQGKTIDQLLQDLKDQNEIVRSQAAGGLGHLKSEKAVEPLIRALKDNHAYVRHGAAWALGEIRSAKAIDPLRKALNDLDEVTRGKAAEALEKIQNR